MAIEFVDDVTEGFSGTPTTLTYAAASTGDLLLASVASKPSSRQTTKPSIFNDLGVDIGGIGSNGTGTGTQRAYCWWREKDGTEPSSDSLTWSGGSASPALHHMSAWSKDNPGAWDVAAAFGDDAAQSTGTGAISGVADTDPGFTAGDVAVIVFFRPTNLGTITNASLSVPGCTVGSLVVRGNVATTAGNDGAATVWSAEILSGSSSGVATLTADVDVANASAGPLWFVRLREPAPSGSEEDLGTAGETDTAEQMAGDKSATIGQAAETDAAVAATGEKTAGLGTAAESDTSPAITGEKSSALQTAPEDDTAASITGTKSTALGPAGETDTAQALQPESGQQLGVAGEDDTAPELVGEKSATIGQADEHDDALGIVGGKAATLGTAGETSTAEPVHGSKDSVVGPADETDTAPPLEVPQPPPVPFVFDVELLPSAWHAELVETWTAEVVA